MLLLFWRSVAVTATVTVRSGVQAVVVAQKTPAAATASRVAARSSTSVTHGSIAPVAVRARGLVGIEAEIQHQAAVPSGDLLDGLWTNELGSQTNLYASLDEVTASDLDYIQSPLSPVVADEVKLTLAGIYDPGVHTDHVLKYRYRKDVAGGDALDLRVRLYAANGSTVLAEATHLDIDALTDGVLALTPAEAATIPSADYQAGLVVGFSAVAFAWQTVRRAQVNSGTTPWDFSSIDLSSAGSTAVRSTASPPGLHEGASFLTCSCSGVDGQNGRARAMIEPPSWPATWRYLRTAFSIYLPVGFKTSIPVGGSAQIWKFDCFPTLNTQVSLLYYQTDDNHKLVVKDAGVDTDATSTFTISEGVWHRIEITMRLASTATGWANVTRDGVLVASGTDVKTIYAGDNGSGHKLPYVRYGLTAHGVGQTAPTTVHIDDCLLEYAP